MKGDITHTREHHSHKGTSLTQNQGEQFSSKWYLCSWKRPCVIHPISEKFPQCRLGNSSSVRLIDDGPLFSFQGRLFTASSFHASLLQVIRWCDVLGFVPAGSVSKLLSTSDRLRSKPLVKVASPASLSAQSFPFTPAYPGQYTNRSFQK